MPVGNQVRYRANFQTMLTGKVLQVRQPHHTAVFIHNLTDH